VIDVRTGQRLPSQMVVIVGNRIRALGRAGTIPLPPRARVVNARGKYLIPGLWDMHVHPMEQQAVAGRLFLANGITGVRDAGSSVALATLNRWKQEIAAGTRIGPRMVVAGPAILFCAQRGDSEDKHVICVDTPAEARLVVDFLKTAGADMVKSYGPPPEVFYALAAEARRVGLPFGGHLSEHVTAEQASDSGQRIIDHVQGVECMDRRLENPKLTPPDTGQCDALAARFKRNQSWSLMGPLSLIARPTRLTDTIVRARQQYVPARYRLTSSSTKPLPQAHEKFDLSPFERADLPLILGSDVAFREGHWGLWGIWMLPGFELQDVLAMVVEHGLTPLWALRAATLNAAEAIDAADSLGTVEVGKVADLVLLDGDPLADIYNTQKIRAVVSNGRYFNRAALDALLAQASVAE